MNWQECAVVEIALARSVPTSAAVHAQQQPQRPNVVIIRGYDIGQSNVSAYSHGLMGYRTPNVDRLAKEGVMFTDYYGEQSCTAGRATGQFGKNHLGDRNEFLPTGHGFDEFYGNLYHLNAEEEPRK